MDIDVVRVWKDAEYRQSLSEQIQVPDHPIGTTELSEEDLAVVYGACRHETHTINSQALICINSGLVLAECYSYGTCNA